MSETPQRTGCLLPSAPIRCNGPADRLEKSEAHTSAMKNATSTVECVATRSTTTSIVCSTSL